MSDKAKNYKKNAGANAAYNAGCGKVFFNVEIMFHARHPTQDKVRHEDAVKGTSAKHW